MHSASQPSIYGLPTNGGTHVHLAMPSIAVQIAFLPQGDNKQGSYGSVGRAATITECCIVNCLNALS